MSLQVVYEDSLLGQKPTYEGLWHGFSEPEGLIYLMEQNDTPYKGVCSLEWNSWRLEGWSAPAEQLHIPYWAKVMSDGTGAFAQPVELQICLPECTSASGLSMRFWPEEREWCSRFTARWYRQEQLLEEETFYPKGSDFKVCHMVKNFDRVVLCWEKTNKPYRYPKLQGLIIGQKLIFGEESLVKVQLRAGSDPVHCSLDEESVTVEIMDSSRPICPQERQKVQLFRENTCLAEGVITSARTLGQGHCILQYQAPLNALEDRYWGGIYWGETAYFVAEHILAGSYHVAMDKQFAAVPITGYLGISSRRKALQQLAFVLGARMVFRNGMLYFLPQEQTVTGRVGAGEIFLGGELKTQAPLVSLEVTAHSYSLSQEEKLLLDAVQVQGENIRLPLPRPAENCRVEGGIMIGWDVNFVTVTANGPVWVYGQPLEHSRSIHGRYLPGAGRRFAVSSCTLVGPHNVEAVMDRLTGAFSNRQILTQNVSLGDQFAGQKISTLTPWGGELEGHITALEATLTPGGQTAAITVQGIETR